MKSVLEQIEWLEYQSKVLDGHDVAPFLRAILSTLRAVEQAEKELPPLPEVSVFEQFVANAPELLMVPKADYDALRAYAVAQKAELEATQRALVKVRAHTSYLPEAPRDLLVGLLASIERICAAAIRKGESHE